MVNNLLGYIVEPRNTSSERKIQTNLQPFYIFINLLMFIVYLFTKDSLFTKSFYSDIPFIFYILLILHCLMFKFYSKACQSPVFVTAEIDQNIESNIENPDPSQFYCKYCHIYVPVRASHCVTCNKCVIRRDHHCPWTNCCIGRDNHFYYFLFTIFAFISEVLPQMDATIHFFLYIFFSKDYHHFFRVAFPYVSFIAATTFASTMTANLCYQCLITIYENLTTWERWRRAKISYLKDLPYGYSPFDKGLIGNFIEFCTMREKKTKWTVEAPDISLFSNELQLLIDNNGIVPD